MNYYKRWNPEKESNEYFKVWSEESYLEGKTIWRLWTEEGIEGKGGKEKSEEFRDLFHRKQSLSILSGFVF